MSVFLEMGLCLGAIWMTAWVLLQLSHWWERRSIAKTLRRRESEGDVDWRNVYRTLSDVYGWTPAEMSKLHPRVARDLYLLEVDGVFGRGSVKHLADVVKEKTQ